ncbi:MAG: hypothetical protein U1G07_06415 [Verrucomicrobiota bacterium]
MKPKGAVDKKYLRKQIYKLNYAQWAFDNARIAARFLHEEVKVMHGPLFYPLISSVCVMYSKPFTNNKTVGMLGGDFLKFPDETLKKTHDSLRHSRDFFYAHQNPEPKSLGLPGEPDEPLFRVVLNVSYQQTPQGLARLTHAGFSLLNLRIEMMPHVIRLCELQIDRAKNEMEKAVNLYFDGETPAAGPHWIDAGILLE